MGRSSVVIVDGIYTQFHFILFAVQTHGFDLAEPIPFASERFLYLFREGFWILVKVHVTDKRLFLTFPRITAVGVVDRNKTECSIGNKHALGDVLNGAFEQIKLFLGLF